MSSIEDHLRAAVRLAAEGATAGQFPLAALVVADDGAGEASATGVNTCRRAADPTAHGEIEAIRAAAGFGFSEAIAARLDDTDGARVRSTHRGATATCGSRRRRTSS